MSRGPYPHCPIAPGKGCATCEDIHDIVTAAERSARRRTTLAIVLVLAAIAASMLAAHILSAA